jgi:hypothetical protein
VPKKLVHVNGWKQQLPLHTPNRKKETMIVQMVLEHSQAITEIAAISNPWQALAYVVSAVVMPILLIWVGKHAKTAATAVTPNHGSSMKDAITRNETRLDDVLEHLNEMREIDQEFGARLTHIETELGIE